jgi:hypothetical protein
MLFPPLQAFFKYSYRTFLNFFIHEVSITWYYKHIACKSNELGRTLRIPSHIWVLEDDTVYLGADVSKFFQHYETPEKRGIDYIANFVPHALLNGDFFNWDISNNTFPKWPLHKWEHIERYSARMLYNLEIALQHGYAAHGEYFSSSVCDLADDCKLEDIEESGSLPARKFFYSTGNPFAPEVLKLPVQKLSVQKIKQTF